MTFNTIENADKMIVMRGQGKTLEECAQHFGCNREYIRQIVNIHDPRGKRVTQVREDFFAEIDKGLPDLIRTLADAEPTFSPRVMAKALTKEINQSQYIVGVDDIVDVLGEDEVKRRRPQVHSNFHSVRRWSDEAILESLRTVYENLGLPVMGITRYRHVAETDTSKYPSGALVCQRFDTWAKACALAGIPSGVSKRSSYVRRWHREKCIEMVAEFIEATPNPSADAYEKWARSEDRPSLATVRMRVGKWNEIIALAHQMIEGKN